MPLAMHHSNTHVDAFELHSKPAADVRALRDEVAPTRLDIQKLKGSKLETPRCAPRPSVPFGWHSRGW